MQVGLKLCGVSEVVFDDLGASAKVGQYQLTSTALIKLPPECYIKVGYASYIGLNACFSNWSENILRAVPNDM